MNAPSSPFPLDSTLSAAAAKVEAKVVAWRRDFHANPELGNREVRTAKIVADHLRALGFDEVREKVAHTGVVGILKGGKPGPVVARLLAAWSETVGVDIVAEAREYASREQLESPRGS